MSARIIRRSAAKPVPFRVLYTRNDRPKRAREKYKAASAVCERLGAGLYRPHLERALAALAKCQVDRANVFANESHVQLLASVRPSW
jgi:hypothetical protein